MKDKERAGNPATSTTDYSIEPARELILNIRRVIINEEISKKKLIRNYP